MDRVIALRKVLEGFRVEAVQTCVDYDPGAGSTYEYAPDKRSLEVVTALLGRAATESDLCFSANHYSGDCYNLKPQTVTAILGTLVPAPALERRLEEKQEMEIDHGLGIGF